MNFDDVVINRRSIRKYLDQDIDMDSLKEIIQFGIYAPSAHNRQPWKVKIVKGFEKEKIADALMEKSCFDSSVSNTARIIKEAPVLILVFYDKVFENRDHDILSIGAFVENMHLKSTEMGYGSLWIANTDYIKEEISQITGVFLECVSSLVVGFKNQSVKMRPRKEIDEIIIK